MERAFPPALREKARQAFAASKLAYASEAWAQAEKVLDGYAAAWARERTDACEATAVRHEQSPELLDLRMACLDDRLRGLAATASLFAEADAAVVAHAASVARALPALASCADGQALRALPAPTPAQQGPANALRDGLAQIRVQVAAGRRSELFPRAQELADQARALGYGPLEADTLLELAIARLQNDQLQEAREIFLHAIAAGVRARMDPVVAAGWTRLIGVCIQLSRRDEAGLAAQFAQAAVSRLETIPAPARRSRSRWGCWRSSTATSIRSCSTCSARWPCSSRSRPASIRSRRSTSWPSRSPRRRTSLRRCRPPSGCSRSPSPCKGSSTSASARRRAWSATCSRATGSTRRRPSTSTARCRSSEAADGKDSMLLVDVLRERSGNSSSLRRFDDALADARRALQISVDRLGPDKFDAAFSRGYVADVLFARGEDALAKEQYRQALEVFDKVGEEVPAADLRGSLALIALREGRVPEARQLAERVLRTVQARLPPGTRSSPSISRCSAGWRCARRDFAEAHRLLTQSVEMMRAQRSARAATSGAASSGWPPWSWSRATPRARWRGWSGFEHAAQAASDQQFDDAYARLLLARSLWATGSDRPRARNLAAAAREEFAARGRGSRQELAEATRFLQLFGGR